MKTICIKTNNNLAINYLLKKFELIKSNDIYITNHKFKVFNNIFIHYKGNHIEMFLSNLSNILVSLMFDIFENDISKSILKHEYFYFNHTEIKKILNILYKNSYEDIAYYSSKEQNLYNTFYQYLQYNNKLFLKGFITFRLKEYREKIEKQIDLSVDQYLIEKEYYEFVSLLKIYVNSEKNKSSEVHLVYRNDNPILLDNTKKIIPTDINLLNAKYLSDISFSNSDKVLNTLLTILPKQIYVHLIDKNIDDFINTLCLIFENKITICNDCNICRTYRFASKNLR